MEKFSQSSSTHKSTYNVKKQSIKLKKTKARKRLEEERKRMFGTVPSVKVDTQQSRNDLCNCGSGLKYKKCCLNKRGIM